MPSLSKFSIKMKMNKMIKCHYTAYLLYIEWRLLVNKYEATKFNVILV